MSERLERPIEANIPAVAASVRELRKRKIHPHFAGYLCMLRAAAAAGHDQDLKVDFHRFFDDFLTYGRQKPNRPFIIPFSLRVSDDMLGSPNYVAGSYARSSLRPGKAFLEVVSARGQRSETRYSLVEGHPSAALEHLLFSQRAPIVPLTIFLYRDYGLMASDDGKNDPDLFVREFRSEFGLEAAGDNAETFDLLFETDASFLGSTPLIGSRFGVG